MIMIIDGMDTAFLSNGEAPGLNIRRTKLPTGQERVDIPGRNHYRQKSKHQEESFKYLIYIYGSCHEETLTKENSSQKEKRINHSHRDR